MVSAVGVVAWTMPLELALLAGPLLGGRPSRASIARFGGDIVVVVILAALAHVAFPVAVAFGAMPLGGTVGELFGEVMRSLFSAIGSYIIGLTVVALILIQRATFSFIELMQRLQRMIEALGQRGAGGLRALFDAWREAKAIDKKSRDEGDKGRPAEPKISAPSKTDAIIAALTAGADEDERKEAAPESMNLVLAKSATEPLPPIGWSDDSALASAMSEAPTPTPKPRKPKRAPAPKGPAIVSPAIDAPPAPEVTVRAAAPAPEVTIRAAAPSPEPVIAASSAAPAAPASAASGPSIVAPPVDPPAIVAMTDMAAGEMSMIADPAPEAREERPARAKRAAIVEEPEAREARPARAKRAAIATEEPEAHEERPLRVVRAPVEAKAPIAPLDEEEEDAPPAEPPSHEREIDEAPLSEPASIPAPAPAPAPPPRVEARPERAAPAPAKIMDTAPAHRTEKAEPPAKEVVKVVPAVGKGFRLPTTDMLEPPSAGDRFTINEEQLKENALLLEKTLADYGVNGKVEEIHPGPTVTTFEVSPAAGTKVSKVASLADDLALGLSRKVRIIAPIPGKNRIGFELPNERRIPVNLRELVEDRRFQEMKAPLPCVLGRDIIGAPYFADLSSMPHVIVAGATGAGKSVGLNVMLVSLLFRKTPEELRLLMIDPKVVELAPFDRIPHMLLPVVTDMKQAANALKWAVDEMERRYQLFANAGTKNITTYNGWVERVQRGEARPPKPPQKVMAISAEGVEVEVAAAKDGTDAALPEKIPYIVIVVDEFADLMMQQGKDVEASVARLAQKARAAGMHVILATQRPSVDVITGMIKANFPTRIAFRVAQKVDSRTILDEQGAEHLLGRGDMLVKMNGATDTRRVQCPFASEEEVQRVTDFLRLQGEPVYDEAILKPRDEEGQEADTSDAEADPMYDAAVRIVAETRRCSTSWIQRKLGVGYNRAAKIVEAMEKHGIVGPANGAKDREVLISPL
jgi:S-DNA-T family DNA segregation ATPase FtsK/SpoIIIE